MPTSYISNLHASSFVLQSCFASSDLSLSGVPFLMWLRSWCLVRLSQGRYHLITYNVLLTLFALWYSITAFDFCIQCHKLRSFAADLHCQASRHPIAIHSYGFVASAKTALCKAAPVRNAHSHEGLPACEAGTC